MKCPDCEMYELITKGDKERNQCLACYQRYRGKVLLPISRGQKPSTYVPIKDASKEEKDLFIAKYEEKLKTEKETIKQKLETNEVQENFNDGRPRKKKVSKQEKDEIVNYLAVISPGKTPEEIWNYIEEMNPRIFNLIQSKHNLTNYLNRNPEKIVYNKKDNNTFSAIISNKIIPEKTVELKYPEKEKTNLPEVNINKNISQEEAKQEVLTNLMRKFNLMNCGSLPKYTLDDIIKTINIIKDLKFNYPKYLSDGSIQHTITNEYQQDILHTVENEEDEDLGIYRKLKAVRLFRRDIEYLGFCIKCIKPLLDGITVTEAGFNKILKDLDFYWDKRENPDYIPSVDIKMIDRYKWANPALKTSNKANKPTIAVELARSNQKVYKCYCEVSGGGYGSFKKITKEYTAKNADEALQMFNEWLTKTDIRNNKTLISNIKTELLNK